MIIASAFATTSIVVATSSVATSCFSHVNTNLVLEQVLVADAIYQSPINVTVDVILFSAVATALILLLSVQTPAELIVAIALATVNAFFSKMLEKLLLVFLDNHCDGRHTLRCKQLSNRFY